MAFPLPVSGHIQFPSTLQAHFTVDAITDPNGDPVEVIDVDQGFMVSGTFEFPNWLSGTVNIAIYADEVGGPFDTKILSEDVSVTAPGTTPPALTTYTWSATYPADNAGLTPLPDPQPGSPVYNLTAVLTFLGPPTDIGGFADMGTYMLT